MKEESKEELISSAIKFYNSKLYIKSIEECKKALAIDHNYVRAHHGIARSLVCLNKFRAALKEYNVVISQEEDNSKIYEQRGDVYLALNNYVSASNDYDRAIVLDPKNEEAIRMKSEADECAILEMENKRERDMYAMSDVYMSTSYDEEEDFREEEALREERLEYSRDWEAYRNEYD